MQRLTNRQKQVWNIILMEYPISLGRIDRKLHICRQAVNDRIGLMVRKGYLKNQAGKYRTTIEGRDSMKKTEGATKITRFDYEKTR